MKRENKKVSKTNFNVVSKNRKELKEYLGKDPFEVEVFVSNSEKYHGSKRLIQEVKFDNLYIKHVWMRTENIGNLNCGYQKIKVKVNEYRDHKTNEIKYGLEYVGTKGKVYYKTTKPKWMLK